jgi:hypothetical protein
MKEELKYKGEFGYYTESDIDSMRSESCGYEYDAINSIGDMCNVLYEGCVGWKHMDVNEVIEYWEENIFPDSVGPNNVELMRMEEEK